MNVAPSVAVAAVLVCCLGNATPVHGQTRFDDIRLIVDATEGSVELDRVVLISDARTRRLRIEDRDGKVRLDASFDQLRNLHFEESRFPRRFARSLPYLTIHYVRASGDPAFAVFRLPGDAVGPLLDTLERDTGLRVDRSAPAASFLGLPLYLTPGYPVEVRDSTGRKIRGQVTALSDTMIELGTAGRFDAASINRIDVIDPIRSGAYGGAPFGILLGIVFWATIPDCEDMCGELPSLAGGIAIGAVTGALIDAKTRRSAYRRPEGQSPRVEWGPLIDSKRKGVHVSLRF